MNALRKTAHRLLTGTLASLLLVFGSTAQAEQFVSHGDYEIHYNAFNSTFLKPEIAQQYQLMRSKSLILLNVSVLKKDGSKRTPVTAVVRGNVENLLQQNQDVRFKEIREENAIYYIGGFNVGNEQVNRVALEVQPDANQPAYEIEFEQTFYTE